MNMFYISAEITDCSVRSFAEISERMMDIPQGGKFIACVFIHDCTKTLRIGKDTGCLDQNSHLFLRCIR